MALPKERSIWIAAGLLTLSAFCLYAVTAAPSLTLQHGGSDGAELATAVHTLGVPHPTGYPTYVLLAQIVRPLPWRTLAGRLNLFSALTAALTVGTIALAAGSLHAKPGRPMPALAAGLTAGLSLTAAGLFWSQAVITEVYSLHTLFLALCSLFLLRWRQGSPWGLPLAGLCLGLGLGNHLSLLFLLPGAALYLWMGRASLQRREALTATVLVLAGLTVYLILPLRAAQNPWLNWGNPADGPSLWVHLSGQIYRGYLFDVPWTQALGRLSASARLLLRDFAPWGVLLGLAGLLWNGERRSERLLLAFPAGLGLLLALTYGGADSQVHLLPLYLAWAVWIGSGAGRLAAALEQRRGRQGAWLALLLPLLSVVPLAWQLPAQSLAGDPGPLPALAEALAPLPEGSLLVTNADEETFPLWYAQAVEGVRRDLPVVDTRLLAWPWYRQQLPLRYPGLVLPSAVPEADWLPALLQANPGRPAFSMGGLSLPADYRLRDEGILERVIPP